MYTCKISFPKSFSFLSFQSEKWWKSFGKYFVSLLFLFRGTELFHMSNHSLHMANLKTGMLLWQVYGYFFKKNPLKRSFIFVCVHSSHSGWWDLASVFVKKNVITKYIFFSFCYQIFSPSTHEPWFPPGKNQSGWIWFSHSSFRYNVYNGQLY